MGETTTKRPRYNTIRERPVFGDRVSASKNPAYEGVVRGSIPCGRGHSVYVDWGNKLVLFEPMGELVFLDEELQ